MRTDMELMLNFSNSFKEKSPTADGLASARQLRPLPEKVFVKEIPDYVPKMDLSECLSQRSSSLQYSTRPIEAVRLFSLIQYVLRREALDWESLAETMPVEIYVFLLRAADFDSGVYRITRNQCYRVADLPSSVHWEDLGVQREFSYSGAIISAAGNLDLADSWGGSHGYRILMGRASSIIYDIHLSAVGEGWVGTVFAGFIPASVRVLLSSDGVSRHHLFAATVANPLQKAEEVEHGEHAA